MKNLLLPAVLNLPIFMLSYLAQTDEEITTGLAGMTVLLAIACLATAIFVIWCVNHYILGGE